MILAPIVYTVRKEYATSGNLMATNESHIVRGDKITVWLHNLASKAYHNKINK